MRWIDATLNIPVELGKDELGNRTVTGYKHKPAKVRTTNWTLEERSLLDPEYTRTNRKLITRADVRGVESVNIGGYDYLITDRIITQRWAILHIRGYKQ